MTVDFKEFGFIPPRVVFAGDAILADQIKTALRPDFPVEIISETTLDQGSAVPLYLLRGEGKFKIVIVSPAADSKREELFALGERLRTVIDSSDKQIAIIASGDLSHRLKKKSPGGYSPKGAKFDNRLIEILSQPENAAADIVSLDDKLVSDAGECGLAPLTVLLGALNRQPWQPEVLAYQTDFGVGYLSFKFQL
jgi:AmmeMemoRadiSam system protein B